MYRETLQLDMPGRGTREITGEVEAAVARSGTRTGLCHVFCLHTSASLVICENADPTVRDDMERFLSRLVPDGDPLFQHDAEGLDDMPAHVRSMLTQTALTLPVEQGRLLTGNWQGLYLYEHRSGAHHRKVVVSVY
ncbi:secondary thiamine-phosphate synthase enzyme [Natronospira proteinivora]|uniref:Secondary thiamine-phosphate synthase enzyme n=1 Tax=Natronospira proteinivora TaxID=1807133 RepID=A0ABT1G517_9GAMM|nr:secondary thiamine-phosphate synthase enzyme YjbQ [Natronospira proteinivora]MCP1726380.1 secondary thiamine-phosphate synthase enzyme [Natronospira proteinivora]